MAKLVFWNRGNHAVVIFLEAKRLNFAVSSYALDEAALWPFSKTLGTYIMILSHNYLLTFG